MKRKKQDRNIGASGNLWGPSIFRRNDPSCQFLQSYTEFDSNDDSSTMLTLSNFVFVPLKVVKFVDQTHLRVVVVGLNSMKHS